MEVNRIYQVKNAKTFKSNPLGVVRNAVHSRGTVAALTIPTAILPAYIFATKKQDSESITDINLHKSVRDLKPEEKEVICKNFSKNWALAKFGVEKEIPEIGEYVNKSMSSLPIQNLPANVVLENISKILSDNSDKNASVIGLPEDLFGLTAEQAPKLLFLRPEALEKNITETTEILGIDREDFQTLVLLNPSLSVIRSKALEENIAKNADYLGITEDCYKAACISIPTMATARLDTIKADMERRGCSNGKEYINELAAEFVQ